jgi:hypothetical protein
MGLICLFIPDPQFGLLGSMNVQYSTDAALLER